MLSSNHWIDISWDGLSQRHSKQNISVIFTRRASSVMDFDRACDKAAGEIYDSYKNLYLGLSGGSDSEYVATCLHRNGIPFTPLILNYNQATSKDQYYETWYALRWCRLHNVQPTVIDINDYVGSDHEKSVYLTIKPRLIGGAVTSGFLHKFVNERQGKLISGFQLEYYPDLGQMTYLEPQLKDYCGFVMEESDLYIETLDPNQHPWAFYYWSPEIMASFVHAWDTSIDICDNKSRIYNTSPRPKFTYPSDFFSCQQAHVRLMLAEQKWGSVDCALLGTKQMLLDQLVE